MRVWRKVFCPKVLAFNISRVEKEENAYFLWALIYPIWRFVLVFLSLQSSEVKIKSFKAPERSMKNIASANTV